MEWNAFAKKNLQARMSDGSIPSGPIFNDISKIHATELPVVKALKFGFPCPDISGAGKKAGFDGAQSKLFFEVMRLIDEYKEIGVQIEELVIENVVHLLSHIMFDVMLAALN